MAKKSATQKPWPIEERPDLADPPAGDPVVVGGAGGEGKTEERFLERSLPDGVVMVTVRIPVFVGKLTGYDAQGGKHVDAQLSAAGGLALSRVRYAAELLVTAGLGDRAGHVPLRQRGVSRTDAIKHLVDQLAEAIAPGTPAPAPAPGSGARA